MRRLLDVNVLIALIDARHPAHRAVHAWVAEHDGGLALCPLVENGAIRIMSQAAYGQGEPQMMPAFVTFMLASYKERANDCEFWSDGPSLCDGALFDSSKILGHRQITDIYLLGLAVKSGGGLVTLDQNISIAAVRGAEKFHLLVL